MSALGDSACPLERIAFSSGPAAVPQKASFGAIYDVAVL
ncbi:hypothetical protein SCE1572_38350 [Sorangium cellulosum So0157-2]|uniref:Uncharacterized protein n=1 Tax=Sorangium cellulosum So0157-2 TaxID=1254432 RepID=S4Y5X2_SORCE|nr:hypothetical protein SCE1572_38350 [Sorangium cellulosum So0157-2]